MESQIFIKGDSSPEINLHLLPVNIQHNGKARVSQFFKIEENSEKLLNGKPTLKAKFRGRLFQGAHQQIPEEYRGFLFREEEHQRDGQEKDVQRKVWNNVGNFSKFTYWMREDLPNEGDEIQRWLNWLQLSKAIHSPLSHDQILNQENHVKSDDQLEVSLKRKIDSQEDNADDQESLKKRKIEEQLTK